MKEENSRRQFLRNTALVTLSAALLPDALKAKAPQPSATAIVCNPTTLDYYGLGPFYKAGAPDIVNNQLAAANETGTRLIISGVVQPLDCSATIENATL